MAWLLAKARRILATAFAPRGMPPAPHLYDRVRARVGHLAADLEVLAREPAREPPLFD